MIAIVFSAVLAAVDLTFKAMIERQEQDKFPRLLEHTGGKIKLRRFHNDGFPFGFMKEHFKVVQMVALSVTSAVAGALVCLSAKKGSRLEKLGLSLVLGGALSNLYDRLVRNYVVDYFSIEAGKLKKVIFNLGDLFVFAGTAIFMMAQFSRDFWSVLTARIQVLYNHR